MGTAEEQTHSKPSKETSSAQAYYGAGATPPFFASTVAPAASHPYMWGGQTANTVSTPDTEGKTSDVKDQTSAKKSKGNSDLGNEKAAENRKVPSGSGNEGASLSAESGSEGSSDASDENNNQQESAENKKGRFDQMLVEAASAQSNGVNENSQPSVPGKPVVPMPATNLNIGMDLWSASPAGAVKVRPSTGVSSSVVPTMVGCEGLMPDHQWIQDERELKRQKRKQSNRESARRSRLRKQAECEELQRRVEALNNENSTLREELESLAAECEKLTSENDSIKEELTRLCGPDALSGLAEKNPSAAEGNS